MKPWRKQTNWETGRGKELALFPLGQITEWELLQQTIKTQQYLQLKCPFMRQDRSFRLISMQLGFQPFTHTNPRNHTCIDTKNHANTDTHNLPNMPQSVSQKWQQTGTAGEKIADKRVWKKAYQREIGGPSLLAKREGMNIGFTVW